jgi:hypothetical protein
MTPMQRPPAPMLCQAVDSVRTEFAIDGRRVGRRT